MKVLVLRGFCIGNGKDVYPGEAVDLPAWQVVAKIQSGHVVLAPDPVPEPQEITLREPTATHRDFMKKGKKHGK